MSNGQILRNKVSLSLYSKAGLNSLTMKVMNMKMILAVMDTVQAVVKIRPEETFRPVRDLNP